MINVINKSIDETIKTRENQKKEDVTISDSLIKEYDVDIFDKGNTNLNSKYKPEELFLNNSSLNNANNTKSYQNIFVDNVEYHQGTSSQLSSNGLLFLWLILVVLLSIVVSKIVNIKRKNANKNRNYN